MRDQNSTYFFFYYHHLKFKLGVLVTVSMQLGIYF